jgi:hypothetical protein
VVPKAKDKAHDKGKATCAKSLNAHAGDAVSTTATSSSSAAPFAFDKYHGTAVKLLKNGTQAMTDGVDAKAVLITKDVIPSFDNGRKVCFKLEVKSINEADTEGLFAIGVTSAVPSKVPDIANLGSAEAVDPAWLLGFDGALWDSTDWVLDDFEQAQLAVGDIITINVLTIKQKCKMELLVNDSLKSSHELPRLEPGVPLHGLLDLSGRITCVALVPPMGKVVHGPCTSTDGKLKKSVKKHLDAGTLGQAVKIVRSGDGAQVRIGTQGRIKTQGHK